MGSKYTRTFKDHIDLQFRPGQIAWVMFCEDWIKSPFTDKPFSVTATAAAKFPLMSTVELQ